MELAAGSGDGDSVDIVLDDREWLIATPRVKDRITVYLGYEGIGTTYMGSFEINSVRFSFPPKTITVRGTAASSLNNLKSQKIQSFEGKTVEQILAEAGQAAGGYKVDVHPSLADRKLPFVNHTGSFGQLIGRLEDLYGAVAKIQDGKIGLTPRGEGKSVSDFSVPTYVLGPSAFADLEVLTESRGETAKTIASYRDRTTNQRVDVESKSKLSDLQTEAEHRITQFFASEDEAKAGAESVQAQLDRSTGKIHATLAEGDPWVRDGQRIVVANCREGINGSFLIDIVRHQLTKSGALRTSFSGTAGTEGLAERYADAGPASPDFILLPPGMTFGQMLPKLSGTELGKPFSAVPALVGQPTPTP
ncbi:phage late control D family protein [Methylobacterium sp. J-090]|uniref:phage late control D family protein n=1 Tax=Methylobacterium sp. J-090 TaxID=2836666 RepID=UPI001FBB772F|nr:hypothetical protein [Methylobacterium sp. J-090]MCJ2081001.1 hypothetical protein [Methylobacterium sp. J-090]